MGLTLDFFGCPSAMAPRVMGAAARSVGHSVTKRHSAASRPSNFGLQPTGPNSTVVQESVLPARRGQGKQLNSQSC